MEPNFDLSKVFFTEYGPLIGGNDLAKILGFRTLGAFNKSIREDRIGIKTFAIPGRKGKFAFSEDVANWLNEIRAH